jgi:hypothetical protein
MGAPHGMKFSDLRTTLLSLVRLRVNDEELLITRAGKEQVNLGGEFQFAGILLFLFQQQRGDAQEVVGQHCCCNE